MWGVPCVSKVPRVHSKYKALMLCEVREIETRYLIKLFCASIESGLFFFIDRIKFLNMVLNEKEVEDLIGKLKENPNLYLYDYQLTDLVRYLLIKVEKLEKEKEG
ncbi:hypothetical protein [Chryseobacterium sp.]|uniref:hypothetical protein n=1 Tax=Chryseobacterium sp. TaxID=1871047 RepID=UPI001B26AC1B|nr:hypothetical protein [Chryseobacterium sp.]MBO9694558.1 hypothetical protein [Chryseobacterium sp.]